MSRGVVTTLIGVLILVGCAPREPDPFAGTVPAFALRDGAAEVAPDLIAGFPPQWRVMFSSSGRGLSLYVCDARHLDEVRFTVFAEALTKRFGALITLREGSVLVQEGRWELMEAR